MIKEALIKKLEGDIEVAKVDLRTFIDKPIGVAEHIDYVDNPTLTITLHNPPYDDETILSKTNWKLKDVTITEIRREM